MTKWLLTTLIMTLSAAVAVGAPSSHEGEAQTMPISAAFATDSGNMVTFLNRLHADNRIGYRLHEHLPIIYGVVPDEGTVVKPGPDEVEALEKAYATRVGVLTAHREVTEEGWAPQDWTFYMAPAADGIDMLWVVATRETGLNDFYVAQQCFRMSGHTNEEWRKKIALTPAFSEYDLWAQQEKDGVPLTSRSYVRIQNAWAKLPADKQHTVGRTPLGLRMDTERTNGNLKSLDGIEPYGPSLFVPPIDSGLAARWGTAGEWVTALYWDRTTHITNHHPADCLHAFVNLGPLPPRSKRAIRGKIYWVDASQDRLYRLWEDVFAEK